MGHEGEKKPRVILIDDEEGIVRTLSIGLRRAGFEVEGFTQAMDGLQAAREPGVDVVVCDLKLPQLSGLDVLRELRHGSAQAEFIVLTGQGTIPDALEAVRLGAYDFLAKPFELAAVVAVVRRAAERRTLVRRNQELEQLVTLGKDGDLIGEAPRMREVLQLVERVAPSDSTVLIQGDSGTGKERIARLLHDKSPRAKGPFVAINCAALPETLLESELFGHAKGAFTGADGAKKGLFETANGGTLFLDEIGDMPLATQVRLLRVLQEGEVRPVGAVETVKLNVRVLTASHVDLAAAKGTARFREDLYYRLAVITLKVPPLRERASDVPLLAHHFIRKYGAKMGRAHLRLSGPAAVALMRYGWPGNVRELENVVQRAVVLTAGEEISVAELPELVVGQTRGGQDDVAALGHLPYAQAKRLTLGAFDRRYLTVVLRRAKGSVTGAAKLAQLDRSNFRRLLRQYGLTAAQLASGVVPDDAVLGGGDAEGDAPGEGGAGEDGSAGEPPGDGTARRAEA